jgi:Rrf2 family protein
MGISTKGRYGIRFMLDLALHKGNGSITLKDIARRQNISEKYLWQVVNPLKSAGLITTVRGSRGGYALAKSTVAITVQDIVTTLEGERLLTDAVDPVARGTAAEAFVTREMWNELEKHLLSAMASITLKDLVDRKRKREESAELSYDI